MELTMLKQMARYMFGEDGLENVPHRIWVLEYERVLKEINKEMHDQGREDEFLGCKVGFTFGPVLSHCC